VIAALAGIENPDIPNPFFKSGGTWILTVAVIPGWMPTSSGGSKRAVALKVLVTGSAVVLYSVMCAGNDRSGSDVTMTTGFTRAVRCSRVRPATARATEEVPLRPNRVHPLSRLDHNNNVGINAPEIEWSFEPDAEWIDITTVHKGGLFGTDYRMLFPGDGIDGIKRFFLDVMIAFGKRGLACQPAIVGIGLGGSKDVCMALGKQAACLRVVGDANPDPEIAALEAELKALGNSIGMGAMGFVGSSMVVDCHIEAGYTHTGGMPISVHTFCLSSRRAVVRIHADGTLDYRTDPNWFTPYMRRDTVEWKKNGKSSKKSA